MYHCWRSSMLRKGMTILLMYGKKSQRAVCYNQITRVLSSQSGENTSCLDSTGSQHNACYSTLKYKIVHPHKVSPGCFVPSHIQRPAYALDSTLSRIVHRSWLFSKFTIEIKSEEQIRGMRDACRYDWCCCLPSAVSSGKVEWVIFLWLVTMLWVPFQYFDTVICTARRASGM